MMELSEATGCMVGTDCGTVDGTAVGSTEECKVEGTTVGFIEGAPGKRERDDEGEKEG